VIGTLLGNRYRIDAKLGEGGMGVVYRAHDSLLQRPVAIKTLTPGLFGEEGTRRILREAQSAAKLQHPHIVSIFDAVEEGGQFAIVMELVEGQTLRELLPVPVGRLVDYAIQILGGLEYAHAQGIVHRDIKPENIIVTKDGTAKLMDFGLARSEGRSRLTQTGMVVGTVAYLAPEQALGGQVDGRSDLYALGAVLYEAVAGRPPFESEDPISVITQHINVPPVAPHWHNPAVPPALENVILKLLAKDPGRRYQSAREAAGALGAVQAGLGTGAVAVPAAGPEKLEGADVVGRLGQSPLVGRDAELARLKELVDRTIAGGGGVVLLSGPLGIGKTRLAEEMMTYARLRGVTVVAANAYESAPPYEPFARALHDVARGIDSETLAARLGEFAPELVALIPELARQLPRVADRPQGSPEDRKSRLFAGVANLLAATAAQSSVVIFFDDMHSADAATVELLQHVARRSAAGRILLVVSYRPDDIPATPAGRLFTQVAHSLGREAFCASIPLRTLAEEQVTDLIERMARHPRRPVLFGRRMFEVTEGNPYFIEEVIKGLFERGTLYIKDGAWTTDLDTDNRGVADYSFLEVPTSVQTAVETRLRHLDDHSRQVLTLAAVVGSQFSFDVLLAITELEEATLLDRVEEAIRGQLIKEVRQAGEDVYEFAQPMLRQVLYEAIPRRRRRLLHRQVGETFERLYGRNLHPHLEALTRHFSEAEDPERILKYAHLAAEKAAALFAYEDAIQYLKQAIEAAEDLDRPAERLALMERTADLLFRAGKRDDCIRQYEDTLRYWKSLPAASNIDGARLCRKLGEIGTRWAVFNPRTREHIREGLRLIEATPDHPEHVKLVIASAFDHFWLRRAPEADLEAADRIAQEGYRLAEAVGSLEDMSAALDALAGINQERPDFPKALEITKKRIAIVERLENLGERIDLQYMLGTCYENLGDYAEGLRHLEMGYEIAARGGGVGGMLTHISEAAFLCTAWDRWDKAEEWCRLYEEAERRFAAAHPRKRWVIGVQAFVWAARGQRERSREKETEYETAPQVNPFLIWLAPYLRALAALAFGEVELTRTLVAETLQMTEGPWAQLYVRTLALAFAAEAMEWTYVEDFGDETLSRSRQSGNRSWIAENCRSLGVHRRQHGRLDEAETLLRESEDLFRALDCPWELGKTLRELALLRRAQGRPDEADRLLREALAHFESLRAVPDIDRTRALM